MRDGVLHVPLALLHRLLDHLEGDQEPEMDRGVLLAAHSPGAGPVLSSGSVGPGAGSVRERGCTCKMKVDTHKSVGVCFFMVR